MTHIQVRGLDHEHGRIDVTKDEDGTVHLTGSSSGVSLGDSEDALLVAKCIEVVAGYREHSDLTEQERERLNELETPL